MDTPVSLTAVACPRCHTLLYQHAELGWRELISGRAHDALTCARRNVRLLATEEGWEAITT